MRDQLGSDLLPHGLAEGVGLSHRVSGQADGDLHHLFLVHDDAVGRPQDVLQVGVRVRHGLAAVLALCVLDVHILAERPGPVQRDQSHEVLEPVGGELADQLAHPRAFQLEHPGRVARAQHLVDALVIQWHMVDIQVDASVPEQGDGVLDDGEVAQAEEVHLQEPELLHPVHVELRHDAPRVVSGVLRQLERQVVDERGVADHDAGRVHRILAPQPLQRPGRVDDLPGLGLLVVGLLQFGSEAQRVLDREFAPQNRRWVHLAEPIAHRRRESEHPGGVPDPLLPLDGLERDDLGHRRIGDLSHGGCPVPLGDVPDDVVPAPGVEVHVDVRHLLARGVQESFEDEPVPQRVEVGDAQAVGHDRPGRRPTPRSDPDPVVPSEPDQVPHDQEIAGEPHGRDD